MPYDHFYHYTGYDSLRAIFQNVGIDSGHGTGLVPIKRFIPLGQAKNLPDKAHDGAVFGLLSPRPEKWLDKKNWWREDRSVFEDILSYMGNFPRILLKVHTDKTDDIYVADWGVHLRKDFQGTQVSDKEIIHDVKKAYWESLVPLEEYSDKPGYRIPEVVCFSTIPLERIEIFDKIARSQMNRYIKTGKHDPAAIKRDKEAKDRADQALMQSLKL